MQKAVNFNNVGTVSIKGSDYKNHFWCMSKNDAINIMKNSNLNGKVNFYKKFLLYMKMGETTYY